MRPAVEPTPRPRPTRPRPRARWLLVGAALVVALVALTPPGHAETPPPALPATAPASASQPGPASQPLDLTLKTPPWTTGNLLQGPPQPEEDEEISFEDPLVGYVVSTGSKRRMRDAASLATISIINEDQIRALPYLYLGDLLSMLPGVDARWGMMQRYYVGIRGLGSTTALNSRLLLLWDGVPMNDPFTGELNAGHFLPLVDVERIEVIRGAGSSMYGANAYSGVVNIVTRDPTELEPREGVRASALFGSFLTSRVQAAGDQKLKGAHVGASVEAFRTSGPFPTVERQTPSGVDQFKNDDVTSVSTEAHVAYKGLQVRGQYTYGLRGRPGTFPTDASGHTRACDNCHSSTEWGKGEKYPATRTSCGNCHAAPRDREETHRGGVAVLYHRWLGRGFRLGAQAYDNEYLTSYKSVKEAEFLTLLEERLTVKQRATGAEAHLVHGSTYNNAVLGTEFRRTEAASQMLLTPSGDDTAALSNIAAFLEDELQPRKWVGITGGLRYDYSTLFGSALAPRGGVVFKPLERLVLKLGASRAFRNPSLSELYVLERRGKYTVRGYPELHPEWINSVEGGASYSFQPRDKLMVRVAGTGFWNQTTGLISIEATSADTATFYNQGRATIYGGEADVEVEYRARPRIRLFGNYSYQHGRDSMGEHLHYAPSSKGNIGLMASDGPWSVLVRVRVVGSRWDEMHVSLPAFATLDASASVKLGRNLYLQVWGLNLTGEDRPESLGFPRAPRSFFASVGYRTDR